MTAKEIKAEYDKNRRIKHGDDIRKRVNELAIINRNKINEKFKKLYHLNKKSESERKRIYYLNNKEKILLKCKTYRKSNPKEKTGKVSTGNYNITLAERHKNEWLFEEIYLYKLKITDTDGTVFYKHGLSKNMRNRLYHIPYKVDVIEAILMNKYDAIYSEIEMLQNKQKYCPLIKFGGHTECFIEVLTN